MSKKEIINKIKNFAKQKRVSSRVMLAIAQIESNFNNNLKSEAGAVGLYQFMPNTFRELMPNSDINNIDNQILAFYKYWFVELPRLLDYYQIPNTNENKIIAYNFGIGNLKANKKLPKETKNYIKKFAKLMINNSEWVA